MKTRKLGPGGLRPRARMHGHVGLLGSADEGEAIATIHRALELGINFLDTAQLYGPMTNEELVGRAIKGHREDYVIATKFARRIEQTTKPGDMSTLGPLDGSAEHVRSSIEGSLKRLGTDHVDLYYQHRVDPKVPIEETVGAMAELVGRARSCISGSARPRPRPCAGPMRSTRSRPCRPSTRCGRATPTARSCPRAASSGSASSPIRRSGAGFSRGASVAGPARRGRLPPLWPTLHRREPARQPAARRQGGRDSQGEGDHARTAGPRLGAGPGRGLGPDTGHQAPRVPRRERRGRGRRAQRQRPGAHRGRAASRCGRAL